MEYLLEDRFQKYVKAYLISYKEVCVRGSKREIE